MATVACSKGEDPVKESQLKGAIVTQTEIARISHGINGYHGSKKWCIGERDGMLRTSWVGAADCTNFATAPGLSTDPLGGVESIIYVVAQKCPAPLRFVSTTRILRDHDIAVADER